MDQLNANGRARYLAEGGMMKKLFAILALLALVGCNYQAGPVKADRLLKTTHAIYLDVRTVVTDPAVMPMFMPAELRQLSELERQYLEAVRILEGRPDDAAAIEQISYLATEILMVLEQVVFVEKVRPYVAAIRISIKLLRNHL